MFKHFTTKQLIFIALIGAVLFLMDLTISTVIDVATGIIGAGYIVIIIFFTLIATVGALIIPKFLVFTIMAFIYAALAIPTQVFGPPGFSKVIIAIVIGLTMDIIVKTFKYKKISYYLALIIGNIASLLLYVLAAIFLGFPGTENLLPYLWLFTVLYGIESIVGVWIGFKLYNKLKNKRILQQISE